MMLAAFLAAGLAGASGLDAMTAEIDRLVLAGKSMPAAFLLDVRRLPSASDRMQAVIYLRRSGLLTGAAVSLDEIVFLRPDPRSPASADAVPPSEKVGTDAD